MSVYRPKGSPYYHFDFQRRGRRFCGSTGCTQKADARRIEAEERRKADLVADVEDPVDTKPRTLARAVNRYWDEIGRHHVNAGTTLTNLERLVNFFGGDRRLDTIDDDELARLVAWRRAQRLRGRTDENATFVTPATVNRSTTEVLQKLFNRATSVWKVSIPDPPTWSRHLLEEPEERVREVYAGEEDSLDAVREDYRLLVEFARASGLRMQSCLLRKSQVDLAAGRIRTTGKRGKRIEKPITSEMRVILIEAMDNPTAWVFTYVARRDFDPTRRTGKRSSTAPPHKKGDRIPITYSGLKTIWRRARMPADTDALRLPADLRFHDLRHDFATKLLRTTGNLKLVQRALDHSKIETTTRYAHVLDDEIAAGMEAASALRPRRRVPKEVPKSSKQSA